MLAQLPAGLSLEFATPGELNKRFAEGLLDVGAMSAHFFLSRDDFELIDTLSISGRQEVGSVLFFTRVPLPELKEVVVPFASQTSVNLLRLLLLTELGISPQFVFSERPDAMQNEGTLLIGDPALAADRDWGGSTGRYDLAQWWHKLFNLPMVFGVWAARKSYVRENPKDFAALKAYLGGLPSEGLAKYFAEVVELAQKRTQLGSERLETYFKCQLDFRFEESHARGLALFNELCRQQQLI